MRRAALSLRQVLAPKWCHSFFGSLALLSVVIPDLIRDPLAWPDGGGVYVNYMGFGEPGVLLKHRVRGEMDPWSEPGMTEFYLTAILF